MKSSYQVTVKVGARSQTASRSMSVTVTNEDDPGSISISPDSPTVGSTVTATLTDEDGGLVSPNTWLWSAADPGSRDTRQERQTRETETRTETVWRSAAGKHIAASTTYQDNLGRGKRARGQTTGTVQLVTPAKPRNLAHVRTTNTSVTVSWSAPDNGGSAITDYGWKRSSASSWTLTGGSTSFTETGVSASTSYTYRVRALNRVGWGSHAEYTVPPLGPGGKDIPDGASKALAAQTGPTELAVVSAPNPFNPVTVLYFHLPEAVPVTLTIYNLAGQPVTELVGHVPLEKGTHAREWHGRDDHGRSVGSGVYLWRLIAGDELRLGKLLFLR